MRSARLVYSPISRYVFHRNSTSGLPHFSRTSTPRKHASLSTVVSFLHMRIRAVVLVLTSFLIGCTFSSVVAFAWTGPSASAPNGNVSAPVNVGITAQIKNGDIGINNISAFGNALLSGLGVGSGRYLNFDYTTDGVGGDGDTPGTGSAGYGIRDSAGTLEFKNKGGTWASLQSTITALCGGGSCGGGAGGGVSGYETKNTTCSGTNHCVSYCTAGKKAVGGDCAAGSSVALVNAGVTNGANDQYCCDYESAVGSISATVVCINDTGSSSGTPVVAFLTYST